METRIRRGILVKNSLRFDGVSKENLKNAQAFCVELDKMLRELPQKMIDEADPPLTNEEKEKIRIEFGGYSCTVERY